MGRTANLVFALAAGCMMTPLVGQAAASSLEFNPVVRRPVSIGPEAHRLIVGFKAGSTATVASDGAGSAARQVQSVNTTQAQATAADVSALAQRAGLGMKRSRQISPAMHVMFLQKTLYGADVEATLDKLRADPMVQFAVVDERRYPHAVTPVIPNDQYFGPNAADVGQWYLQTPTAGGDASAIDAVSAWAIATGSPGVVIADIDTGVRFDHPDLLRAGFGGRLLPGYDFVDQDFDASGQPLGTYLYANDGDGWDPDPSDPGDWISAADLLKPEFPADCGDQGKPPFYPDRHVDSSWHGTRVAGVLGALTDITNRAGVAGVTWDNYILPVRALGKCGGFDSDIIAGMQWAAGISVPGVPMNPYPAKIINLSLGSPPLKVDVCPDPYLAVIPTLTNLGVLIVASAGNGSADQKPAPVDSPGNCPGILAVAGLRNVGTKVGFSSFGKQIGVSAPGGNCINTAPGTPCLRPIDTTTNFGLTGPGLNGYTPEINPNTGAIDPNLGTSFSSPMVAGIAGLMRSVNANLTPQQLIARIEGSSVKPFPQGAAGVPVCDLTNNAIIGECTCTTGTCGAGMVNAYNAVLAAQKPIAAMAIPASLVATGSAMFDASSSAASCGRTIMSYAWSNATGGLAGVTQQTNPAQAAGAVGSTTGTSTLTLTVTDNFGDTDTATVTYSGNTTSGPLPPTTAGTGACPLALSIKPIAPTVSAAFSPASVNPNAVSTLTITLNNANGFALIGATLTDALPASLTVPASPAASTTCAGPSVTITSGANSITIDGAIVPASSSCNIMIPVESTAVGSYTYTVAANDFVTATAGNNSTASSATLTVVAPSKSGGGALGWPELVGAAGILLASRRRITALKYGDGNTFRP